MGNTTMGCDKLVVSFGSTTSLTETLSSSSKSEYLLNELATTLFRNSDTRHAHARDLADGHLEQ